MRDMSISMKSLSYMRNAVTNQLNMFIINTASTTFGRVPAPTLFSVDGRASMNESINEDGFCGMLEAMVLR